MLAIWPALHHIDEVIHIEINMGEALVSVCVCVCGGGGGGVGAVILDMVP